MSDDIFVKSHVAGPSGRVPREEPTRGDLSPVASPVRADGGERGQEAEGTGAGER